ncbi:MAG TPA: folate-binding protein [Gammaproteobacteria bacterium]|nr:folate-binding protein [Gammaproteobacteria bacterium]
MGLIKQTTKLDHLGIIELQGNDSAEFLQGQMTQDIYSIEDSKAALTSILNPQGRIISTAFIFKWGESFILMVSNEVRDKLIAWLSRFILRSEVQITQSEDCVFGLNQENARKLCVALNIDSKDVSFESDASCLKIIEADDERAFLVSRSENFLDNLSISTLATKDWKMADINAGIPTIYRENIEKFIPQMVNLDLINGISFSKGCYTGQEIVARVQHKGKVKQRMFHITGKASNKKIDPGTAILFEDTKVGTVIESLEDNGQMHALGVIKNDASKKRLVVDGTEIKLY